MYKRALHSSFVVSSKSVVNSDFVDVTHKSRNTVKYSVLHKSVFISVCNTSSRFSYEFRHFGWTNNLTCEKKKTNFRNGGKICLPRAPTPVVCTANRKLKFLQDGNAELWREPAAASCKSRRFVSSLLLLFRWPCFFDKLSRVFPVFHVFFVFQVNSSLQNKKCSNFEIHYQ